MEAKFTFKNIFDLSRTNKMEELPAEWTCVNFKAGTQTQCICNRTIKNAYYYVNILNGNTIRVGSTCVKRLQLKERGRINEFLRRFCESCPDCPEYKNIYDILSYSEQAREDMLRIIEEALSSAVFHEQQQWLEKVVELREIFHANRIDCTTIDALYARFHGRYLAVLRRREEERLEQERLEQQQRREEEQRAELRRAELRREQQRREQERLEQERLEEEERQVEERRREEERKRYEYEAEQRRIAWELAKEKMREEEKERQRVAKEKADAIAKAEEEFKQTQEEIARQNATPCACGVLLISICRCEKPAFELYKLNKQYRCTNKGCGKWKDRC